MSAAWEGRVAEIEADAQPGRYYVTARHNGRTAYLLGPFEQRKPGKGAHLRALGALQKCRRLVHELNPREAPWLAFGTSRLPIMPGPAPVGVLNGRVTA